jgi:leucyl aminopeptidase
MDFKIKIGNYDTVKCDALALWFFKGQQPFTNNLTQLDKNLDGLLSKVMALKDFKGEIFEMSVIYTGKEKPTKRVILIGLGEQEKFSLDKVRRITGEIGRRIQELGIEDFTIPAFDLVHQFNMPLLVRQMVEGYTLGLYRFDHYFSKKQEKKLQKISFLVNTSTQVEEVKVAIKRGLNVSESTIYARDLVNHPPNVVHPIRLVEEARKLENLPSVKVTTWQGKEVEDLGMGGLVHVARGSVYPATFSVIDYTPQEQAPLATVVVIGKSVTFDSGGLSLKPAEAMMDMKGDMAGGAAVLGILSAVTRLKLPLRVIGMLPSVENMPSGSAYRVGDIIRMYSGKTVEIINTDAEGRLILADAMTYAQREYQPDIMIDLATLTGACTIALGRHAIAAMSNNKELLEMLRRAGEMCNEKIVELPLWEEYAEMLKSNVADLKNLAGREAGAITAAAFLHKFIEKDCPWVHLDVAGVSFSDVNTGYHPIGATGAGVRLIIQYLRDLINVKQPGSEGIIYSKILDYPIAIEDYSTPNPS